MTTKAEILDREAFVERIEAESSNPDAERLARLIMRHAATHRRLSEEQCSGPRWTWSGTTSWEWSQKWQDRVDRQVERTEALIRRHVAALGDGFGADFQGDPRGATVKLTLPSGFTDDWGGEGFCVPVRS